MGRETTTTTSLSCDFPGCPETAEGSQSGWAGFTSSHGDVFLCPDHVPLGDVWDRELRQYSDRQSEEWDRLHSAALHAMRRWKIENPAPVPPWLEADDDHR